MKISYYEYVKFLKSKEYKSLSLNMKINYKAYYRSLM